MRFFVLNTWRTGAVLIVVVVVVINVFNLVQAVPPPPAESPWAVVDPATRAELRLATLRAKVQERGLTGTIGYLGDLPGDRLNDDHQAVEDYYLTQFVLVPLVLDLNPSSHGWAVANLRIAAASARVPGGWKIEEDFGNGVLLLRKKTP